MSQRYIGGLIYNPPGGFSGSFSTTAFLSASDNAAFNFGAGDFTLEAFVYITTVTGLIQTIVGKGPDFDNGPSWVMRIEQTTGYLAFTRPGVASYASTLTVPLNQWSHVQISRVGSNFYIGVNGINQTVSGTYVDVTSALRVGFTSSTNSTGIAPPYISNLRILKGTALYTSSTYTVPVGPLQAITNTSLLTCAYPTFRDGSTNNFTITVNGNTAVSTQNPFPQTQLPNPALGNQGNGVYSMSQYQALRSQNLWPAIDQYWPYVTLMLHGNGTNGAQNNTFLDSSTNNFTITRNGNTTQGTFSPYGSNWSNYFDGTGDYLSDIGTTSSFNFLHNTTALFTFECWVYLSSTAAEQYLFDNTNGTSSQIGCSISIVAGGAVSLFITRGVTGVGNVTAYVTSTGTVPTNQWVHVAVTYDQSLSSNNAKFYINGAAAGSGNKTGNTPSSSNASNTLRIGTFGAGAGAFITGYISNLRISNSIVYSSAFTPSTSPLTAISGTALLTCADNRFIDDSSNNFTITANGNTSIQRFSPFAPTTPYAAGTIGGSGYFDGTNDYLSLASNAAFNYGTGDFRFDFWIYPTGGSGPILEQRVNPSTAPYVGYDATNQRIEYYINSGGTLLTATPNGSVQPNRWSFITVSRVSNTSRIFVNGVERSSAADNNNYGTTYLLIGASISGGGISSSTFPGYMGDYRVVKGSGVSSGFSVPTSPLTAITNTSLLCNFTNAAIIDNAMMNDLETVGNAQISTSVSRFGGGSLDLTASGAFCKGSPSILQDINGSDFTIEFWVNFSSLSGDRALVSKYGNTAENAGGLGYVIQWVQSSAVLRLVFGIGGGTDALYTWPWSPSTSIWYHIAVTRSGTSARAFVNGTQIGTTTTVTTSDVVSPNAIQVGKTHTVNQFTFGYIDDLRITKGYARYTANFTPQRSQWQDQ